MGNSSDDLAIGTRVGDYQILGRLVGRGPALAYEAIHVMLPRRVALKVMPAYDVRASGAGLLREACIVESIEHPGVPRLYECGVLPDRRAWIAFELVAGESLARVGAATPIMAALDVAGLLRDVADILVNAHAIGLVHGNLVPATITIPDEPRRHPLFVGDWGTARTFDALTEVPMPSISARPYAAPEQLRGEGIDDRADIHALGVIAYELLYGALPSQPIEAIRRDVPEELALLLHRMFTADPERRPNATQVRAMAATIVDELIMDAAIPIDVVDADDLIEDAPVVIKRARVITSELVAQVAGEIDAPAPPPVAYLRG
jgi:serine/threonine protein kinase